MDNDKSSRTMIPLVSGLAVLFVTYLPTFIWMVNRWMAEESYYSHGFLIPVLSAYFIWKRRRVFEGIGISYDTRGLFIALSGLSVHIFGSVFKIFFISGFSFVITLYGLIMFFLGKATSRRLLFPVIFLLTMVPLPLVLIGGLTVKLKLFVAQIATVLLNIIGLTSVRDGSIIRMPNSYVMVDAPCSGLRSLVSLLTLGLLFAYIVDMSRWKRGLLFVSSIPIALASNILRTTMLAMVNDIYGERVAMGFFHDFSGFLMFGFALAGLFGMKKILDGIGSAANISDERKNV